MKFFKFPQKKRKPLDRKRLLRNGSYSAVLTAFVVAGAVVVNLIAAELPSQYTSLDVSDDKLYTLTDQTKKLVSSLTEDVTLYYIVQDSNRDSTVSRLLERYDDLSSHITVEERDPVLYPSFVSQYTSDSLTENSVIVVCGDQSRIVNYEDMYEQDLIILTIRTKQQALTEKDRSPVPFPASAQENFPLSMFLRDIMS